MDMQPLDYGAVIRSGQAIVPDFAAEMARKQLMALQQQQIGLQITQARREQQDAQAFDEDLDGVFASPTAENYTRLLLRHPKMGEKVKAAWGMLDESRQKADLTQMGEVYSAAANGRYDLAAANLRRRVEANRAAGHEPDPDDTAVLGLLESGDLEQQKKALGMLGVTLAAITGPDKFAATMGSLTEGQGDFTLAPGGIRYDHEGNVLAAAPFAPRPLTVEPGKDIVEYQPGTGGTAPTTAPTRAMGWTPRASNGGDNSDKVVDNKLGVIAKTTGLAIDAPLKPENLPTLFDAIIKTENMGAGYNNPGGIKDGSFAKAQPGYSGPKGGFATFSSFQAGRQAGIALLGQYYNRGQRSIRDIIEGKPIGAGKQAANGPVQVRSKQEYDRLASGAQYIAPDGSLRVKG